MTLVPLPSAPTANEYQQHDQEGQHSRAVTPPECLELIDLFTLHVPTLARPVDASVRHTR